VLDLKTKNKQTKKKRHKAEIKS